MDNFKCRERSPAYHDRWGVDTSMLETDLLAKKDSQINRLQQEVESERKRADNAIKILESFRGAEKLEDQNTEGMKSQVSRRLKAEEESRLLRIENSRLKGLIAQHIDSIGTYRREVGGLSHL